MHLNNQNVPRVDSKAKDDQEAEQLNRMDALDDNLDWDEIVDDANNQAFKGDPKSQMKPNPAVTPAQNPQLN